MLRFKCSVAKVQVPEYKSSSTWVQKFKFVDSHFSNIRNQVSDIKSCRDKTGSPTVEQQVPLMEDESFVCCYRLWLSFQSSSQLFRHGLCKRIQGIHRSRRRSLHTQHKQTSRAGHDKRAVVMKLETKWGNQERTSRFHRYEAVFIVFTPAFTLMLRPLQRFTFLRVDNLVKLCV